MIEDSNLESLKAVDRELASVMRQLDSIIENGGGEIERMAWFKTVSKQLPAFEEVLWDKYRTSIVHITTTEPTTKIPVKTGKNALLPAAVSAFVVFVLICVWFIDFELQSKLTLTVPPLCAMMTFAGIRYLQWKRSVWEPTAYLGFALMSLASLTLGDLTYSARVKSDSLQEDLAESAAASLKKLPPEFGVTAAHLLFAAFCLFLCFWSLQRRVAPDD